MKAVTTPAERYEAYDRHPGDRKQLFSVVQELIDVTRVLYPGSYIDVAASFVFDDVTYVDVDRRAARFFGDREGVQRLIEANRGDNRFEFDFLHADYMTDLGLPEANFDLLISLYAGFVSEHCTRYLRPSGWLLASSSHGDAAMASLDQDYELVAVLNRRSSQYQVSEQNLDTYLIPKNANLEITPEYLHQINRGIGYTKSASGYLFQRSHAPRNR